MKKFLAFLKKEFFEMLPPTIFFLVVFQAVILARTAAANALRPRPLISRRIGSRFSFIGMSGLAG